MRVVGGGKVVGLGKGKVAKLEKLAGLKKFFPLFAFMAAGVAFLIGFVLAQELEVRYFSLGFSAAAIFALLMFVRKVAGVRAALFAMPVLVIAPFLLRSSLETEPVALAMLVAGLSALALVFADEKKRWWAWGIYGIIVAFGIFITPLFWLVFAAETTWSFLRRRQKVLAIAAFAAFLAMLVVAFWRLGVGADSVLGVLSFGLLWTAPSEMTGSDWRLVAMTFAIVGFAAVHSLRVNKYAARDEKWRLLLLFFLAFVPIFAYSVPAVLIFILIRSEDKKIRRIGFTAYLGLVVLLMLGLQNLAGDLGGGSGGMANAGAIREIVKAEACAENSVVVVWDLEAYAQIYPYVPSYCDCRFFSEERVSREGDLGDLVHLHDMEDRRVADMTRLVAGKIVAVRRDGEDSVGADFARLEEYVMTDALQMGGFRVETFRREDLMAP